MATNIPRSMKDASVLIADTDGTNSITLTLEDGDLSYSLPDTHEHVMDRGGFGNLIEGADEGIAFSFTAQVKEITGSAGLQDVITCTASGWDFSAMGTSPSGDFSGLTIAAGDTIAASGVGVFQMTITLTDPGDASTETLYLINCRASIQFQEGMPSKFSVTGVSYMSASAFMSNVA